MGDGMGLRIDGNLVADGKFGTGKFGASIKL